MNPGPYSTITAFVLLLLLFSNHCCFHPSCVTCASPGVAELTTQLRRPLRNLWLPLCRINIVIPYTCGSSKVFLRRCQGAIALLVGSLGKYTLSLYSLYCDCYQWLTFLKLDLIGKADSRRINKNIIPN